MLLLTMLLVATSAPQWAGASTGASFTAGGVVVDSVRYAKEGDVLTLTVATPAADCVRVVQDGVELARQTTSGSESARSSWVFSLQAGAGDGPRSVSVTAHSNRGCAVNQQIEAYTSFYRLDNTKPALTGALQSTNLGDDGWYRGDATIVWTCADEGSGLAPDACPGPSTVTGEGAALSAQASVSDRVGNQQTTTVSPVKIDRTPPVTLADAPTGWRSTGVEVTLSAEDNLSGIADTWFRVVESGDEDPDDFAPYTGPIPITLEGIYDVDFYSRDGAGNTEQVKSATVMIDMTAPTIRYEKDPLPNGAGWNRGAQVEVTFRCDDLASGIADCDGDETVTDEVEGYAVEGTAIDNAGNPNQATAHVHLDRTRPTVSALVDGEAELADWYTDEVTVTFTCADPVSNGVASGIAGECPAPQELDQDGAGQSVGPVSVLDLADNESEPLVVEGINIDTVAPDTTASLDPASEWSDGPVEVSLDADDATSGVASTFYSRDGGAYVEYEGPLTVSDEGVTVVSFYSVDVAGNVEQAKSVVVRIDETAPVTTVASVSPEADWANGAVTVRLDAQDEVGGSGVAATSYQVGDGEVLVYDDGDGIVLSTEGVHLLRFWSVDVAGNVEDDEDNTLTVQIDTTGPELTGTPRDTNEGDNGWYTGDVTVDWTCFDALSGIAGDCPEPSVVEGEGDELSAVETVSDRAGNRTTTLVPLRIDRTPPVTAVEVSASGWTNEDEVTVTLTPGADLSGIAGTFHRRVVDGTEPFEEYTGPIVLEAEGVYEIEFYSRDNAGNDEDLRSTTVEIDRTAPTITSSQNPLKNDNGWNRGPVRVTFRCDDPDGEGPASGIASCTTPVDVDEEVANHKVTGTAVDRAGNPAHVDHFVSIDMTDPTISALVDGQEDLEDWYTGEVTVTFTCEDPVSNGVASGITGDCPTLQLLDEEGAGQSVGPVSVLDLADNESEPLVVEGINIDTVAPATTASLDPDSEWANGPVEVSLDADDVTSGVAATFYSLDSGVYEAYEGPFTVSEEGETVVSFYSVDVAGNVEVTQSVQVWIDETAPQTTVASMTPDVEWANGAVTVLLDAQDEVGGSGVAATSYQVGDGEVLVYDDGDGIVLSAEGVHLLRFWSEDVAGNVEDDEDNTLTVQIDTTTPTTTSNAPSGWQTEAVTVELTVSDVGPSGLRGTYYRVNEGPKALYAGGLEFSEGEFELEYWSVDHAGNEEPANTATIQVDLTDPDIQITAPADGATTNDASVTVEGTATDGVSGLDEVTVEGTAVEVVEGRFQLADVDLDCGANTITAAATDVAGRSSEVTATVTRQCQSVTRVQSPLSPSSVGSVRPNDVKRGRVVPVKVEIESQGQPYQAANTLQGAPVIRIRELANCATTDGETTQLEGSVGNANSGADFRWSSDGHWIYNLATDRMTTGKCYRLDVEVDGHRASNDRWAVLKINR